MARGRAQPAQIAVVGPRVLSQRGYSIVKEGNEAAVEQIRAELTVSPKVSGPAAMMPGAEAIEFPVYRENSKKIYVPRNWALARVGPWTESRMHEGTPAPRLIFQGTLRPEQAAPVAAYLAQARSPAGGGLLILPCAFGKTSISLYIAAQIGRKTLVVCHKSFLMDQWRERIAQFVPAARVGLIKADKIATEDCDIVIASLQSLAMKEYPASLMAEFGMVITDETHHLSAEVFSRALAKITAPVMLGLTATPDRKDGLRRVFEWYIGPPAYEIRKRDDRQLRVIVKKYYTPDPDYSREWTIFNGQPNTAKMINAICAYPPRNRLILDTLAGVLAAEPGRKVILLSDRRAHLKTLKDAIDADLAAAPAAARTWPADTTTGYYVGGMKQSELDISATKKIIFATGAIANEGLDIPALNTLIFASPVSSLEQPVGRIQRQKAHEREFVPIVIDIQDQFSLFQRQAQRRLTFYRKSGYEIVRDAEDSEGEDPEAADADAAEAAPKKKVYQFRPQKLPDVLIRDNGPGPDPHSSS